MIEAINLTILILMLFSLVTWSAVGVLLIRILIRTLRTAERLDHFGDMSYYNAWSDWFCPPARKNLPWPMSKR